MSSILDNSEWFERVQRYVAGELTPDEIREMEALMDSDAELAEAVNFFRQLEEREKVLLQSSAPAAGNLGFVLAHRQELSLAYELNKIMTEIPPDRILEYRQEQGLGDLPRPGWWNRLLEGIRYGWRRLLFLLAVGGFLTLLLLKVGDSGKPPAPVLDTSAITDYEFPFGGGEGSPAAERAARRSYLQGEYNATLPLLDTLLRRDSSDAAYANSMRFYRGLCRLRLDDLDGAVADLQPLQAGAPLRIDPDVPRFYLAVAFYRQGRLDKAAALFATLTGSTTRLTGNATIGEWAGRFMEQWE